MLGRGRRAIAEKIGAGRCGAARFTVGATSSRAGHRGAYSRNMRKATAFGGNGFCKRGQRGRREMHSNLVLILSHVLSRSLLIKPHARARVIFKVTYCLRVICHAHGSRLVVGAPPRTLESCRADWTKANTRLQVRQMARPSIPSQFARSTLQSRSLALIFDPFPEAH